MKINKFILAATALTFCTFTLATIPSCKKKDKTCAAGYSGSDCNTKALQKFAGSSASGQQWKVKELLSNGGTNDTLAAANSYSLTIAPANTTTPTDVIIQNIDNDGLSIVLNGVASTESNSLVVSSATFNGSEYAIQAANLNTDGTMSIRYTVKTNGVLVRDITATLTK